MGVGFCWYCSFGLALFFCRVNVEVKLQLIRFFLPVNGF